jgi:hypothetical protein
MTKPSKGAAAFLVFFGLMFLVPGLLSFVTFLARNHNAGANVTIAGAAIGLFISAIGAGFVFAAWFGYGRLKKQAAVEEANPRHPGCGERIGPTEGRKASARTPKSRPGGLHFLQHSDNSRSGHSCFAARSS